MSCGDATTPCHEVLGELWLYLDHECDEKRREVLQRHLDECGRCLEHFGIEEHLKELLARKCGGEQASEDFKQRLRASIRETVLAQAEVTVEPAEGGARTVEVTLTNQRVDEEA